MSNQEKYMQYLEAYLAYMLSEDTDDPKPDPAAVRRVKVRAGLDAEAATMAQVWPYFVVILTFGIVVGSVVTAVLL